MYTNHHILYHADQISIIHQFHTSTSHQPRALALSFGFLYFFHSLGFFLTADIIINNRIHEIHEQSQANVALAHGALEPGTCSIPEQEINGQLDETSKSSNRSQSPVITSVARPSRMRIRMDLPSHDRSATGTIAAKNLANWPKTRQSLAQHTAIEES